MVNKFEQIRIMFRQRKNPFIHGTTTECLAVLEKTNFTLMDPIDMVDQYGLAPVTGELNYRGGYNNHTFSTSPKFGRCTKYPYNLMKVIKNNTVPPRNNSTDLQNLLYHVSWGYDSGFSNINLIIIYAARCKQQGIDISTHINNALIQEMRDVKNILSLGLYLCSSLHVNNKLVFDDFTAKLVNDNFKMTRLCPLLSDIDLFEIYNSVVIPESVRHKIIEALTLPETIRTKDGIDVSIKIRQPFTFVKEIEYPQYVPSHTMDNPNTVALSFASNSLEYGLAAMLMKMVNNVKLTQQYMCSFRKHLSNLLYDFGEKINILDSLINRQRSIQITPFQLVLPLIWVCHKDKHFRNLGYEFEAISPLRIGKEIKIAATDSEESKLILKKYFQHHKIKCKVILFDELERY